MHPTKLTNAKLGRSAGQIFAANDRINQLLIEHLHAAVWRAQAPGKARTIVAIFTHMHNARCKWVRLTAPHLKAPSQLHRAHCTPQQARAAIGAERRSLCGDAGRSAQWWGPRPEVSPRRLGSTLAGGPGNAVLHACSRSPPSRTGVHARGSTRIPIAEQGGVRDVELGKVVERMPVPWRPWPRFLRW